MLAYVDDCLSRQDRAALEDKMIESPEIRSQIDIWLLQNEAIRAAFPDRSSWFAPTAESKFASKSFAPDLGPQGLGITREGKGLDLRPTALTTGARLPRPDPAPPRPARRAKPEWNAPMAARRLFGTFLGALAFWAVGGGAFSGDHPGEFTRAATAAYRTYADNATRPVEIATSDRAVLNKWFAPQIARAQPVLDLAASGLVLLGGRIVPGAFSPGEFQLYENPRHERIALQVEAIDSPPETDVEIRGSGDVLYASWTGAGHSFALVGRASPARLTELARRIRESQPGG
jgi:anti-sigma factor RsiW